MKLHKILRTVFLYVIPAGVALFMLAFAAAVLAGLTVFEAPRQITQMLTDRAPYIAQALINLAMLITVCICGALLYTKNGIRSRRGLLLAAVISGVCAVLMHAMVYGVVIAVPAPYTLLTPGHITLRVFAGVDAVPFAAGGNMFLVYAAGIVIHLFAPQVLLAFAVCAIALKRYVRRGGSSPREAFFGLGQRKPPTPASSQSPYPSLPGKPESSVAPMLLLPTTKARFRRGRVPLR